ncbi:unnamed protein product [Blepharisma stoltei]|uniref:RCC1-like domain-containing protein n=1 Tax=Blepharisma stoltei TaxID=1481888 RepID=A0AAU9K6L5_9CILI|nr:unnamed protein product [Blepharisma stoltei]
METGIIRLHNVYTRGINFFGALGLNNHYQNSEIFVPVPTLQRIEAQNVYASYAQSLCLMQNNDLLIWGWPLDIRSQMQVLWMLKDYTTLAKLIQKYSPFPWISIREGVESPTIAAEFPGKLQKVSIGGAFVLACDDEGRAFAWGDNHRGQCGTGEDTHTYRPYLAKSILDKFVIDVKAGYQHSLFLTHDGDVYATGRSANFAIAKPPFRKINTHGFTSELYKIPIENITKIAAGQNHSLFLNDIGEVLGCGKNNYGQCGQVSTKYYVEEPTKMYMPEKIKEIACGSKHSLALGESGKLYSWGCKIYGQVDGHRNGIYQEQSSPLPVEIPSEHKIVKITAAFDRSGAWLENGEFWTWGGEDWRYLEGEFYENFTLLNSLLPNSQEEIVDVGLGFIHTLVMTTSV